VLGRRQRLEVEQHPHAREDLKVGRVRLGAADRAGGDQIVHAVEQHRQAPDVRSDGGFVSTGFG
jgi:hypothetical protein